MSRSPFASLVSNVSGRRLAGPGPAGIWTGRVAFVHKDEKKRITFLFDVIPLNGWPAATESISVASSSSALKGIPRVRLAQSFVSSLSNKVISPTGIIVVPTVGSVVTVAHDDVGWVIIGFQSGPVTPVGGFESKLGETSFNPGFEEAAPSSVDISGSPWLLGLSEGDVVLGRGDSRVKLCDVGVLVGSGANCLHMYKNADGVMYERYAEFERRAVGRSSYHKFFRGTASAFNSSFIKLDTPDAYVINTDIIDSTPDPSQLTPYVVRQVGRIPSTVIETGRLAGETRPLPTVTTSPDYTVIRETVIQPTAKPTGKSTDIDELRTTSHIVFDKQVGPDGSFHIRAGNIGAVAGPSLLGETSKLDLDISYDVASSAFAIKLTKGGAELANLQFAGTGDVVLAAKKSITLSAPLVRIDAATSVEVLSQGTTKLEASGAYSIDTANLTLNVAGELKAIKEVLAGIIALSQHKHLYTDDGSTVLTQVPAP